MLPGCQHVADSLLCLLVFFPSMLCYWRGIWDLYGVYLFPDDPLWCDWATFALGCGALLGYFYQPALDHLLHRHVGLVDGRRSWKGLDRSLFSINQSISLLKQNGHSATDTAMLVFVMGEL